MWLIWLFTVLSSLSFFNVLFCMMYCEFLDGRKWNIWSLLVSVVVPGRLFIKYAYSLYLVNACYIPGTELDAGWYTRWLTMASALKKLMVWWGMQTYEQIISIWFGSCWDEVWIGWYRTQGEVSHSAWRIIQLSWGMNMHKIKKGGEHVPGKGKSKRNVMESWNSMAQTWRNVKQLKIFRT